MADHTWPGPRCAHCNKPRALNETGEPCDGKIEGARIYANECGSGVIDIGGAVNPDDLPWEPGDVVQWRRFDPDPPAGYGWAPGIVDHHLERGWVMIKEPSGLMQKVEARTMRRADHLCPRCLVGEGMAHERWCANMQPTKAEEPPAIDREKLSTLRKAITFEGRDHIEPALVGDHKASTGCVGLTGNERMTVLALVEAELRRGVEDNASCIGRVMVALWTEIGYGNFYGKGDTLEGAVARMINRHKEYVKRLDDQAGKIREWRNWSDELAPPFGSTRDRGDDAQRLEIKTTIAKLREAVAAKDATITKLCEEKELLAKQLDESRAAASGALNARDQVFAELLAFKKATMLDPPSDDYGRLTPDHLRQHLQDLGDAYNKADVEKHRLRKLGEGYELEIANAWEHLDKAVDGQPYWSEREIELDEAVATVLKHYREQTSRLRDCVYADSGIQAKLTAAREVAAVSERDAIELREKLSTAEHELSAMNETHQHTTRLMHEKVDIISGVSQAIDGVAFPSDRMPLSNRVTWIVEWYKRLRDAMNEISKLLGGFGENPEPGVVITRVQSLVEQIGMLRLDDGTTRADLTRQIDAAHDRLTAHDVPLCNAGHKPMSLARRIDELADERNDAKRRVNELAEEMTRDVDAGVIAEIGMSGRLPDKTDLEDDEPPADGDDPWASRTRSIDQRNEEADDIIEDVIDRAADKLVARIMGDE
jgi:hypothetical protein